MLIVTASGMCRYVAQNAQVVVIQVDFRLGPEHPTPAQVEDCTAAYKWVSASIFWARIHALFPAAVELTVHSAMPMPPSSMVTKTISSLLARLLVEESPSQ